MLKKLFKLLYKTGLLKHYEAINRLRYLNRLRKGRKKNHGNSYVSEWDMHQFKNDDVIITSRFRGTRVLFSCNTGYTSVERDIILQGMFEPHLLDIMSNFLPDNCVAVDVGANIGAYSLALAKAFPKAEVHAFEPSPFTIRRFLKNVSLNDLPNLHLHRAGAGSAPGRLRLHTHDNRALGHATFVQSSRADEMSEHISVDVTTLDGEFMKGRLPVRLIKIDVQGFELDVLLGAVNLIKTHRPHILFEHEDVNFNDTAAANAAKMGLKKFFEDKDYNVYYITKQDPDMMFPVIWENPLQGNLLALPVKKGA